MLLPNTVLAKLLTVLLSPGALYCSTLQYLVTARAAAESTADFTPRTCTLLQSLLQCCMQPQRCAGHVLQVLIDTWSYPFYYGR